MAIPKMTVISPTPELAEQINRDVWVSIPKKSVEGDPLFMLNGGRIFSGKYVWMPARDLLSYTYSLFCDSKDIGFFVSLKFKTQQVISAGLQIYGELSVTDMQAFNKLIDMTEKEIKNTH